MSDETKAVFLSYAREDTSAAQRIAEALRAAGVEVWFDQSELRGGDAWDQKIRTQIKECALFLPVISANTQSRHEGYFRLEWRLADQRTHLMGKSRSFLVPVCVDATRDGDADVPDSFLAVQWMRLTNGEANHAFCERVKILLAPPNETGRTRFLQREEAVASRGEGTAPATAERVASAKQKNPPWLTALIVIVPLVVGLMLAWRVLPHPANEPAAPARPRAVATPAAPMSEARQLVAKARALFDNPNRTRDDFLLAEDFCRQALKLDPNDADVWAVYSELDSSFIASGVDSSPDRVELGRMQADRALKLAPRSTEARLAKAIFLRRMGGTTGQLEAEKILRELVPEAPNDPRVLINLAKLVWGMGSMGGDIDRSRAEEALGLYDRAAAIQAGRAEALGERGWLLVNLYRYDEAATAIDESLRLQVNALVLTQKIILEVARGNNEAAAAAVAQLPDGTLHSDYGALNAIWTWLPAGQPEKVLQLLNTIPHDYLSGGYLAGTADGFRGIAYQMMGREDAARTARRTALQLVETRLRDRPRDAFLLLEHAYLLAYLGERDAAATALRLYEQMYPDRDVFMLARVHVIGVHALLDPPDAVIDRLEQMLQGTKSDFLRSDFRFAMLRGHPRFQALVERLKPVSSASKSVASDKSIAVLAFANFGGDKENEYFSDGITEELLNVLAKVPGLRVAARTSAFYFKDKNVPIPEIAQKLNVAYVVEGSVQKSGTRVKITAQLIKAADGFQMWSKTFTQELKDVFAMQDEIAGLIAEQLQLSLGEAPHVAKVVNPEAHQLVLEGRYFWLLRTDDGFARAEQAYAKALKIDPEFAEAHAGLANVCAIRGWYSYLAGGQPDVDFARARDEAQVALRLDPSLAEAHAALGAVAYNEWKFPEAEQAFQTALRLNPNYSFAHHWRAHLLLSQGRIEESVDELERANQLDPLQFITLVISATHLSYAGRYAEALAKNERALALRQDVFIPAYGNQAVYLLAVGRTEEAVAAARVVTRDITIQPRWWEDANAIYVLRTTGHEQEAVAHGVKILASLPPDSSVRTDVLAGLGRMDEAIEQLGRVHPRPSELSAIFCGDAWSAMRQHPKFPDVLAKLGLLDSYRATQAELKRLGVGTAATK